MDSIKRNTKWNDSEASNATLTAEWTPNKYPYVTNHYKMGTDGLTYTLYESDPIQKADYESQVTPPVKTYVGFASPSTQTITIGIEQGEIPENNVVNYNYVRIPYLLQINKNNGTGGTDTQNLLYEQSITIVNPTRTGYNLEVEH